MGKEKSPRRVADNEALSVGTQIRGSAQKLNLVAALIRGRKVEDAMNILTFSKKAMAVDVRKVLASAVANAARITGLPIIFYLLGPRRCRIVGFQFLEPGLALCFRHLCCVTAIISAGCKAIYCAVQGIGFIIRPGHRIGDHRLIPLQP